MTTKTTWQTKTFSELSLNQLYDVLKLRVDVFVVEQTCFYPDLDSDKDVLDRHPQTLHLLGYQEEQLVAYLRILPKGQSYPGYISIGRVVTASQARGAGLGHELMLEGISRCQKHFPKEGIKISAQQHLKGYYQQYGFIQASEMYLEDNIPHIAMIRQFRD
ncbi:GNAT family N-acetyltransferase [Colwellia psychrerythraea]|uniref:Protein ElaA n=1 Tax=Colwellia psychrerythraea TaxID=28229 RepID=A0A099KSU3_COLPS|nr:GNAT family N-acetyltransferase [Colwellia psychrerythraea]KGJ93275.1 GCN5-related N-acetyltransferase [Colwellia psychrerythraea]